MPIGTVKRLLVLVAHAPTAVRAEIHARHVRFIGRSAFVLLLPCLSAPVLARLYSPEDYGLFATYMALVTPLTVLFGLSLSNAVMVERGDPDAELAAISAAATSVGLSIVILVPLGVICAFLGLVPWISASCVMVVVPANCAMTVFYSWAIRTEQYDSVSRQRLVLVFAATALQIALGLASPAGSNFVIIHMLTQVVAFVISFRLFLLSPRRANVEFECRSFLIFFRRHRGLAAWTTPGSVVNSLSTSVPDLLVSKLFGSSTLGQLAMGNRVVNLPMGLFASSIQEIFRQKASLEVNQSGNCSGSFRRFLSIQLGTALLVILPIVALLPHAIPFIFGDRWQSASWLVVATSPLLFARFVSSPLSYVWILRGRLRLDAAWQVGLLFVGLAGFALPFALWSAPDARTVLFSYSTFTAAWYVVCIVMSQRLSR